MDFIECVLELVNGRTNQLAVKHASIHMIWSEYCGSQSLAIWQLFSMQNRINMKNKTCVDIVQLFGKELLFT